MSERRIRLRSRQEKNNIQEKFNKAIINIVIVINIFLMKFMPMVPNVGGYNLTTDLKINLEMILDFLIKTIKKTEENQRQRLNHLNLEEKIHLKDEIYQPDVQFAYKD